MLLDKTFSLEQLTNVVDLDLVIVRGDLNKIYRTDKAEKERYGSGIHMLDEKSNLHTDFLIYYS